MALQPGHRPLGGTGGYWRYMIRLLSTASGVTTPIIQRSLLVLAATAGGETRMSTTTGQPSNRPKHQMTAARRVEDPDNAVRRSSREPLVALTPQLVSMEDTRNPESAWGRSSDVFFSQASQV
ncbi:hypothetical protein MGYG_07784 [Nannizzia gypsea CBS 118893]|uniref:Uncharacterized protein n=1 Tax=Arthroderma gypseum (strain ATCC MYA-4604 / CBS 118893) TaxID=535722 RepID=E4V453_ARTGP|nr:hypothetical protein MGYG_07784 [Nannizzia gypsea CBS 118893]EFR04777.1 hypothetical protein MGYG_07784 [Nannizzia gypsea CBS 118893]